MGAMTFIGRFTEKAKKVDVARYFIVVALGIIGVAVGIASSVIGKGRKVTDKPLAEV